MITTLGLNILLLFCLLLGVILTLINLPGNALIFFVSLAYGYYQNFSDITYRLLLFLLMLWLVGELAEFFTGALAARNAKASKGTIKAAVAGAVLGGLLGTAVIPLIGSLIGTVAGVFAASYLAEFFQTSDVQKSKSVALHAAKGQILGTMIKLIIAVIMTITMIYNLKW